MKNKILYILSVLFVCTLISACSNQTMEDKKSCITPYEMIERIKAVEIDERHITLQKIIEENGFESYFEKYFFNGEFKHTVLTPVIYEYKLGEKEVVLMLMKEGRHQYDYLLFVKEYNVWSMNCVVSVSERNSPYFSLEYTPDGEDFWLVYREEVGHGTGESVFRDIWVNRYGEEVLRYPSNGYKIWQTTENIFLHVNYHAERSHSLQDVTIDEYSDNHNIPPYSVRLNCYTNFGLGEYYGEECFERYDILIYYWNNKDKKFVIDLENISESDYATSFSPDDVKGKDVCGEDYFDYTDKYYKLFEEKKANVNTVGLSAEEVHQNIIKAFRGH